MKKLKTKDWDTQKKRLKSVESVLRPEGSLWWWERFVKEVGLEPGVKERGSYGWLLRSVASSRIWTRDLLIASPNPLPVAPPRQRGGWVTFYTHSLCKWVRGVAFIILDLQNCRLCFSTIDYLITCYWFVTLKQNVQKIVTEITNFRNLLTPV